MDATQLQQYEQLMSNPSSASVSMTSGGNQQGLSNFFNSPIYSLMYGQQGANQAQQAANNGTYNPITAFQQYDPSYQYQINTALQNVQNQSAAKGLLDATNTQANMLSTAQNLQNTQYQNYLSNLTGQFGNYQNQLAGLANNGTATNEANSAYSSGQNLAGLLSNANLNTGSQISSANQNTGQTISQLLANLGVSNANALLGLGSAQSNNIFQGNQFTAQTQANANASNAQAASNYNNLAALTPNSTPITKYSTPKQGLF